MSHTPPIPSTPIPLPDLLPTSSPVLVSPLPEDLTTMLADQQLNSAVTEGVDSQEFD